MSSKAKKSKGRSKGSASATPSLACLTCLLCALGTLSTLRFATRSAPAEVVADGHLVASGASEPFSNPSTGNLAGQKLG